MVRASTASSVQAAWTLWAAASHASWYRSPSTRRRRRPEPKGSSPRPSAATRRSTVDQMAEQRPHVVARGRASGCRAGRADAADDRSPEGDGVGERHAGVIGAERSVGDRGRCVMAGGCHAGSRAPLNRTPVDRFECEDRDDASRPAGGHPPHAPGPRARSPRPRWPQELEISERTARRDLDALGHGRPADLLPPGSQRRVAARRRRAGPTSAASPRPRRGRCSSSPDRRRRPRRRSRRRCASWSGPCPSRSGPTPRRRRPRW